MKLYVVFVDIYAGYGTYTEIAGIFSSKEKANIRLDEVNKKYCLAPIEGGFIEEIEPDKKCEICISSYFEDSQPENHFHQNATLSEATNK